MTLSPSELRAKLVSIAASFWSGRMTKRGEDEMREIAVACYRLALAHAKARETGALFDCTGAHEQGVLLSDLDDLDAIAEKAQGTP